MILIGGNKNSKEIKLKNILVVIKDLDEEKMLLAKALRFSPNSLCVMMVNPVGTDEAGVTKKICNYIATKNSTETKVDVKYFYEVQEKISAQYLVNLANTNSSDLILLSKPELADGRSGLVLVKDLLKSSIKAKILLARRKKWPSLVNTLCAIDIGSKNETQLALDKMVFEYAKNELHNALSINLHLASIIPISRVSTELDIVESSDVLLKKGPALKQKLNAFDQENFVSDSKKLVAAGMPYKQICSLAKKQKIDLVVIGNVGRKGLKGLVMGSTAVKILKNISSDVLVVNGKC